jgi:hypothetical protein
MKQEDLRAIWAQTRLSNSMVLDASDCPHIAYSPKEFNDCYVKYIVCINNPSDFDSAAISTNSIKWTWNDTEQHEDNYVLLTSTDGIFRNNACQFDELYRSQARSKYRIYKENRS